MSTSIQQRAKELWQNLYGDESDGYIEISPRYKHIVKSLTAQQAESEQAHGEEVDRLTKERDEAKRLLSMEQAAYGSMSKLHYTLQDQHKELRAERDALTRQVEELTKDKVMLDDFQQYILTHMNDVIISWTVTPCQIFIDRPAIPGGVLYLVIPPSQIRADAFYGSTLREAITSAMKGETHE